MTEPKRGAAWLKRKLANGNNGGWHEPEVQRFDWRLPNAVLVDTRAPARTYAQEYLANSEAARLGLKASEAVAMMSIRAQFRDRKRKGKLLECWFRCELIRRVIVRARPTREGISHDHYARLMAFLVDYGIAQPRADGRIGYEWCESYKHLHTRADWLCELASRAGELRRPRDTYRYEVVR